MNIQILTVSLNPLQAKDEIKVKKDLSMMKSPLNLKLEMPQTAKKDLKNFKQNEHVQGKEWQQLTFEGT